MKQASYLFTNSFLYLFGVVLSRGAIRAHLQEQGNAINLFKCGSSLLENYGQSDILEIFSKTFLTLFTP